MTHPSGVSDALVADFKRLFMESLQRDRNNSISGGSMDKMAVNLQDLRLNLTQIVRMLKENGTEIIVKDHGKPKFKLVEVDSTDSLNGSVLPEMELDRPAKKKAYIPSTVMVEVEPLKTVADIVLESKPFEVVEEIKASNGNQDEIDV